MERLLEDSKDGRTVLSVKIADIGGGAATLYVLNGGRQPPIPSVGDLEYDFSESSSSLYEKEGWRRFTVEEVKSILWHPNGSPSVLSFTASGLPYWKYSKGKGRDVGIRCSFDNTEGILLKFRTSFDVSKFEALTLPAIPKRKTAEENTQGEDIQVRKRACLTAGHSRGPKDASRFIRSREGFPECSKTLEWSAGYTTYEPFAGKGCRNDAEGLLVKELSRRASLESSGTEQAGPEPDSFRVEDLIVELELDPALQNSRDHDDQTIQQAWTELAFNIRKYMARSTSVVVRGWNPTLSMRFSKDFLTLQLGSLSQGGEWVDGSLFAKNREVDNISFHKTTTLAEFVDLAKDSNVCGNFLDGKDVYPSPPTWATPLLDSITAWNQTMHLRFSKKATRSKKRIPQVLVGQGGPSVVRAATWTSQGWRILTHPGFVTFPHHDCCGMCTYVVANSGAKIWGVMRPKRGQCPTSLVELPKVFKDSVRLSRQGHFSKADVATVCLEEGDVMFQPPGVLHCVYTPVPSVFSGGYFYSYETMHLTRAVFSLLPVDDDNTLTNDERPGYIRTLCRMLIALRYRSETRRIGKRSFISLLLIILDEGQRSCPLPNKKDGSGLAEEERGEIQFAISTAEGFLKWMKFSVDDARKFVINVGPYYSGGEECVEIPALRKGKRDPIFPYIKGFL